MRNGNSTRPRSRSDVSLSKLRSAISNGSSLLADVDHRSAWMRRLRDLIAGHVSDLGGEDALSAAEVALIRRASMMTLQLELMEARWNDNNGEASPRSLETYQRVVGALRRTLESLGLQRRPRDVTPSIAEYARQVRERAAI
jgi:hypothetical protein